MEGRLTFLRVHDVGTMYGGMTDRLDVEVVVRLDTIPDAAFGFQLRPDDNEATRRGMLDVLRLAVSENRRVRLDYLRTDVVINGVLSRVAIIKDPLPEEPADGHPVPVRPRP
jgi:hypothetical protein